MTREEFEEYFGLTPEKCKELMEALAKIVNEEVREAIAHADYYMNPLDYCDKDDLKETYGEDCLEKEDEDDDGYTKLYDFKKNGTAAYAFQRLISIKTTHAGYGSATAACKLMELEGWRRLS